MRNSMFETVQLVEVFDEDKNATVHILHTDTDPAAWLAQEFTYASAGAPIVEDVSDPAEPVQTFAVRLHHVTYYAEVHEMPITMPEELAR